MASLTIPSVERYVPALDGIRAFAVLVVIVAHLGLDNIVPGGFGVTTFFWVSGFLITGQLIAEIGRKGRIDLPRFYLRRFIRLMPAAAVYIVIAGVAFILAGGSISTLGWLAAFFYGVNYYELFVGYTWLPPEIPNPLTHLWSLSVEEHYYILWPIALIALRRHRAEIATLLALCLVIVAWRFWLFHTCYIGQQPGPPGGVCGEVVFYRLYEATDTRLDSIAWGAVFALLAASSWRNTLQAVVGSRIVQAVALAVLTTTFLIRSPEFREVWRYSLQGIALCVLIPAACGSQTPVRWVLERRVFVLIGRLSYSLYLWSWGAIAFTSWISPVHNAAWVARAIVVTVLGAAFSYYAIERPMVALRRQAGSHATAELAKAG
jgi:peptidoglycan/LPS O-acetylase OafA/YrhL